MGNQAVTGDDQPLDGPEGAPVDSSSKSYEIPWIQVEPLPLAWEEKGAFFTRLGLTFWQVQRHPLRSFTAPPRLGYSAPALFAALVIAAACAMAWFLTAVGLPASGGFNRLMLLKLLSWFFILTGLMHLGLLLAGGAKRTFLHTFRVAAYGQAVVFWLPFPWLGPWAVLAGGLMVGVAGLAASHGIGRWQALIALVFSLIVFLGGLALLGGLMGLLAAPSAQPTASG